MRKLWLLWIVTAVVSCGKPKEPADPTDQQLLVAVGDSSLYMSDVLGKIPRGLDPADSARMFHSIVDTWVRNLVLSDVAAKNLPDPGKIDRMVEAYRNSLIVNEYLSSMVETEATDIPEERIRKYYEAHQEELILKQPLVKGGLIKVAQDDKNIDNLRKWMTEFSDESIDKIEKSGMRNITLYEYFSDDWYEWNVVADQIPYRFDNADTFIKANHNFETTGGEFTYLLHISDYVPTGTQMPYEFAKLKIREILRIQDIEAMRSKLIKSIYRRKINEGGLKPGLYDVLNDSR